MFFPHAIVTRQTNIQTISKLLDQQSEEKLEALLSWLMQEDDSFEKRLRANVDAGKLDRLIADAIAEDDLGETITS